MSQSEVERFARDARSDAALRTEIAKAGGLGRSLGIAKKRGYAVTEAELAALAAGAGGRELSGAELDAAAGGFNGGGRLPEQPDPDPTNPHRDPR